MNSLSQASQRLFLSTEVAQLNQATTRVCMNLSAFNKSITRLHISHRKWKPGQPDNWNHGHEEGEDCAGLIHEASWNDFFCTDRIGFICERTNECE